MAKLVLGICNACFFLVSAWLTIECIISMTVPRQGLFWYFSPVAKLMAFVYFACAMCVTGALLTAKLARAPQVITASLRVAAFFAVCFCLLTFGFFLARWIRL